MYYTFVLAKSPTIQSKCSFLLSSTELGSSCLSVTPVQPPIPPQSLLSLYSIFVSLSSSPPLFLLCGVTGHFICNDSHKEQFQEKAAKAWRRQVGSWVYTRPQNRLLPWWVKQPQTRNPSLLIKSLAANKWQVFSGEDQREKPSPSAGTDRWTVRCAACLMPYNPRCH